MIKALTFDDILMPPKWSDVESRNQCNTSSNFSRNVRLTVPIASANMRTVTGPEMCNAMALAGGIGILHRAHPAFKDWRADIDKIDKYDIDQYGISIGINTGWKDILDYVYNFNKLNSPKPRVVVIDVAHAGNSVIYSFVQEVIEYRKTLTPKVLQNWDIVVGNIATAEAASMYKKLDIDGLKVGVGPGAACTTRIMTGCGVPQFTAIQEISRVLKHSNITLIADGGIQQPGHAAIALAAGADCVMMGKVLSYAKESPGWTTKSEISKFTPSSDQWVKTYQGEASFREDRAPEGVKQHIVLAAGEEPETVNTIMERYKDYIQSSMSYQNARTIEHFQENATFIEVSTNTLIENKPRF